MPELFRFYGFLFYFYSKEHEPIHVHVEGSGGLAIFDYDQQKDEFVVRYRKNILEEMIEIIKIYFDEEYIYGESTDGQVYRQSLLWYPHLKDAKESERMKYEFGLDGIHWRNLDEDISFESFGYDDAEPTVIQRFFLTHPEISVSGFAKRIGIGVSNLRDYINGFTKQSSEWEEYILNKIHDLGIEMTNIEKARS